MLKVLVPATELWDERNQEFIYTKDTVLTLEHSLLSISKWESKWHKPYLTLEKKTFPQTMDYIKCMTLTPNVDPMVYNCLTKDNHREINEYINDTMTAAWFKDSQQKHGGSGEQVTSDLIYYWMVHYNIPFECEKWHLNRLMTLIKICTIKESPSKKMSKKDTLSQYAAINAARRKKH